MLTLMLDTIKVHQLIAENDKLIVGVSGGPDSMALVHALMQIKDQFKIEIIIVHINHMFRGDKADADEQFVSEYATKHHLKCYIFRENVAAYAESHQMGFEEAGREIRYQKFYDVLNLEKATKIAVAQNKNDTVETFLINLMRGAGIEGLASIDYQRDEIIRPLLDVSREDIENYCQSQAIKPRIDHTNFENDYTRNKVRNLLIPFMEETFNPGIKEVLYRTSQIMKKEKQFWKVHTEKLFAEVVFWEKNEIVIDMTVLMTFESSESDHLLRLMIKAIRGHLRNITQSTVEAIKALQQTGTFVMLDESYKARLEYGKLIMSKVENTKMETRPELICLEVSLEEAQRYVRDNYQIHIDADQICGDLQLRHRIEGDRMVPLGMKGSKKIKDILIDKKISKEVRDKLWLIQDEDKVIWIEGICISETVRITKNTEKVMIIGFDRIVEKQ